MGQRRQTAHVCNACCMHVIQAFHSACYAALQVRRVLDQIRGRSYEEALMILEYTPYRACELIIKTLVSVRPRCCQAGC